MNILMVSPNVVVGGAQKVMLYLAKGLEERRHNVFIYTTHVDLSNLPPFARKLKYIINDMKILQWGGELSNYTPIDNVAMLAFRLVRLRRGLVRAIKKYRIDMINPHNPPANWLCSFLRYPVVWTSHNNPISVYKNVRAGYDPLWPNKRKIYHQVLELAYEGVDYIVTRKGIDEVVSVSDKVSRGIRQVYHRGSEVIMFGLAPGDGIMTGCEPQNNKFDLLEENGLTLIQVGQLTEDKQPYTSLDILEIIRGRIPKVKLCFVGDGPLRPQLEQEVKSRGLEGVVSFLGFKNERELANIYASAHILLFPGRDQPFGLAPIEAIWKFVVPIVSDTSGVKDLFERHGITTVAKATADSFAEHVFSVYERRSEVRQWLAEVRKSLAEELNYERFLDKYEKLFERCLTLSGKRIRR